MKVLSSTLQVVWKKSGYPLKHFKTKNLLFSLLSNEWERPTKKPKAIGSTNKDKIVEHHETLI